MKIKINVSKDEDLAGEPWRLEVTCEDGKEYNIGVGYLMSSESVLRGFDHIFDHAVSSLKLAFHRKIIQDIENKQKEKSA